MNARIANTARPRAALFSVALFWAALTLAVGAQSGPPGWSGTAEREATLGRESATSSGPETELFAGSMVMAAGTRTPRWNLPVTMSNSEVVIEGSMDGNDAQIALRAWAGTTSRDQKIDLTQSGAFVVRGRFVGAFDGIDITHVGGATLTITRVSVVPAGAQPATQRVAPQPEPSYDAGGGAYGDPATQRMAPVPDDQPPYRDEPSGYGPPERVELYRGDARIPEGRRTQAFPVDPTRRVLAVETVWSGWFFKGSIYLLVDGESSSRWSARRVRMREVETWTVNDYIRDVSFAVRESSVNLQRVSVVYEGRPIYAEEPPRQPADYYPSDPRPPLPPTVVPVPPRPPFLPHPGDFVPDPPTPSRNVVTFGPTRVRENRSVTLRLPERRYVEAVEIRWSDGRDKAVGYVSVDDENWNARRGQDVGSPDVVDFRIEQRAHRITIHARKDDINITYVKVYVR